MRRLDSETWDTVQCAKLADKGLMPVAGGMLDQSAQFINAMHFIDGERARWRAKLKIFEE